MSDADSTTPRRKCAKENCGAPPQRDKPYCIFHDPELAKQRHENAVEAGKLGWVHFKKRRKLAAERHARKVDESRREQVLKELSAAADKPRTSERLTQLHGERCACPACQPNKPLQPARTLPSLEQIEAMAREQKKREQETMRVLVAETMRQELVARIFRPEPKRPVVTPQVTVAGLEI